MELKEELKALVELVKRNSKRRGEKLSQEDIAGKFGIGRTYLSDLISGNKPVYQSHIDDFKLKLREYLIDITPDRALLNVLLEDYAEFRAKKEKINKDDIIKDLKNKANSKLSD